MSGSRSRRRRKRAAAAKRDDKPVASRTAPEPVRRRVAPVAAVAVVAKDAARDADPAALRSELRALKRALALAEEKANDADAKRVRAVNRATATLRRENESLEAHLTLLVQEIGQIKHLIDRVPRLEADLRTRDLQLAEREQTWRAERARLEAEVEKLSARAGRSPAGIKTALAAAAGAGSHAERVR
jgi:chromosome segregation ATPase